MENYIQAEDYELWMLIKNGPLIPKKTKEHGATIIKKPEEFDTEDYKMMEKNAKAKKLLHFGLGPDEYSRISKCESAKDIWDVLQVAHEGTNQVKQSRIEFLVRKYELFEMGVVLKCNRKCTVPVVASNDKYGSYPQGTCLRIPELVSDSI